MKFTTISTFLIAAFAFSEGTLVNASPHLRRGALSPQASNIARSPDIINPSNIPTPTPPALFPRQNTTDTDAKPFKTDKQLTLTAVPANTTTVFVSSTSTGPAPTGTVAAIGGIAPPNIETTKDPDRPFAVDGNTFTDREDAVDRACSIQHNACADAINQGALSDAEISDCDDQQKKCVAAG